MRLLLLVFVFFSRYFFYLLFLFTLGFGCACFGRAKSCSRGCGGFLGWGSIGMGNWKWMLFVCLVCFVRNFLCPMLLLCLGRGKIEYLVGFVEILGYSLSARLWD